MHLGSLEGNPSASPNEDLAVLLSQGKHFPDNNPKFKRSPKSLIHA
jgi:hypothetical protein